ncbi:MAG TPA: archease [Phycisphaerae bacterium]|nr:archease [Phycisphaerae bacterium]
MQAGFELFDHTADVGIRVFAPDMNGLIEPAARGLYAVIGELAAKDSPQPFSLDLSGDDSALLLRDYLTELLILFERDQSFVESSGSAFNAGGLSVRGRKFAVDEAKSVYYREVKAITYHELAIRPVTGGYEATIIVDI